MPATAQDITHYAGDSAIITIFPVLDGAGQPVDLTGATARWWMGKSATATGTDVWVKKSSEDTLVNEAGATIPQMALSLMETDLWGISIVLIPSDTETTSTAFHPQPGSWYHECEVEGADGKISTVTLGKYVLKPTVVRNA